MIQHPEHPQRFVLRILSQNGLTAGAGVVISEHLAVRCAHVVLVASNERCITPGRQDMAGEQVTVEFYHEGTRRSAKILYAGWSPPEGDDVAFLWLEDLPDGIIPATLGTAENRSGHPYTALGFPLLFDREARYAHDYIGGVVPVTGRRAMLQIEGKKIEKGMSGAPVFDRQANRVVGIVNEFVDAGERFAYATTTDTFVMLYLSKTYSPRSGELDMQSAYRAQLYRRVCIPDPAAWVTHTPHASLRMWPDSYGPIEWNAYLDFLIGTNETLKLPDGREVPLENVYVSLRADAMNAAERKAEHDLYVKDVQALMQLGTGTTDQYRLFAALRRVIARHPIMQMLIARNWDMLFGEREHVTLNLADVIKKHQFVVVLGDPVAVKPHYANG